MKLNGGQALIKSLEMEGVEVMFGLPGGAILPVYDPIIDSPIRHILVRHEQGAGHMAEGYAHATGKPGVAMVTSGPGATNIVTPLADAFMDSVPMVCITGQVPTSAIGTDAFQEADISGITMPITKHNFLVRSGDEIPRVIAEAFHIAATGRPGAVLVDIPKDVLQATCTFSWPPELDLPGYKPNTKPHSRQIREAAKLIAAARKPVLYVGGGVIRGEATEELLDLAELTGIPVVTTLMARGAFPDSHPQHLGMPGMHGTVAAVAALVAPDSPRALAITHTSLHGVVRETPRACPGYSSTGTVDALGSGCGPFRVGDVVACPGGHISHATVDAKDLLAIPPGVDEEQAVGSCGRGHER